MTRIVTVVSCTMLTYRHVSTKKDTDLTIYTGGSYQWKYAVVTDVRQIGNGNKTKQKLCRCTISVRQSVYSFIDMSTDHN
jgi:hypothetical protein